MNVRNAWRHDEDAKLKTICQRFPYFCAESDKGLFSSYHFINALPYKFFSRPAFERYYSALEEGLKTGALVPSLKRSNVELGYAIRTLSEVNQYDIHDDEFSTEDVEWWAILDRKLLPATLKLMESVYANLTTPLAWMLRISMEKKKQWKGSFDATERMELIRESEHRDLYGMYCNRIRNAIAHGTYQFQDSDVLFVDRNKRLTCDRRTLIQCFDELVDSSNGLLLAILLFFLRHQPALKKAGVPIPKEILQFEVNARCSQPGWSVSGWAENGTIHGNKQLVCYVQNGITDRTAVLIRLCQLACALEHTISGRDRYFISSVSRVGVNGCARFVGEKLKLVNEMENPTFEVLKGAIENALLFPHAAEPSSGPSRLEGNSGGIEEQEMLWTEAMSQHGIEVDVQIRHGRGHMHDSRAFLFTYGWLTTKTGRPDKDCIRRNLHEIVSKSLDLAGRKSGDDCFAAARAYYEVYLFDRDMRTRVMRNSGLVPGLICKVLFSADQTRRVTCFNGGSLDRVGEHVILWNDKPRMEPVDKWNSVSSN